MIAWIDFIFPVLNNSNFRQNLKYIFQYQSWTFVEISHPTEENPDPRDRKNPEIFRRQKIPNLGDENLEYFSTFARPLEDSGISRNKIPIPGISNFRIFWNFFDFSRDFFEIFRKFLGFSRNFLGFSRDFLGFSRNFLVFSRDYSRFWRNFLDFLGIFGFSREFFGIFSGILGFSGFFQFFQIPIPGISGFPGFFDLARTKKSNPEANFASILSFVLKSALSLVLQEYFVPTLFLHLFLRNFVTCF